MTGTYSYSIRETSIKATLYIFHPTSVSELMIYSHVHGKHPNHSSNYHNSKVLEIMKMPLISHLGEVWRIDASEYKAIEKKEAASIRHV